MQKNLFKIAPKQLVFQTIQKCEKFDRSKVLKHNESTFNVDEQKTQRRITMHLLSRISLAALLLRKSGVFKTYKRKWKKHSKFSLKYTDSGNPCRNRELILLSLNRYWPQFQAAKSSFYQLQRKPRNRNSEIVQNYYRLSMIWKVIWVDTSRK